MRYADYEKMIMNENDLIRYKRQFEKEIADKQKELSEFIDRAHKRLKQLKEYEENKQFVIVGGLRRKGRGKEILLIVRYPDGTQRDERYSFDKIAELREKLGELKEKYSGVDWSQFSEEI